MTNVLRKMDENKIIIIFIIIILSLTVYTGIRDRNLNNIKDNKMVLLNK